MTKSFLLRKLNHIPLYNFVPACTSVEKFREKDRNLFVEKVIFNLNLDEGKKTSKANLNIAKKNILHVNGIDTVNSFLHCFPVAYVKPTDYSFEAALKLSVNNKNPKKRNNFDGIASVVGNIVSVETKYIPWSNFPVLSLQLLSSVDDVILNITLTKNVSSTFRKYYNMIQVHRPSNDYHDSGNNNFNERYEKNVRNNTLLLVTAARFERTGGSYSFCSSNPVIEAISKKQWEEMNQNPVQKPIYPLFQAFKNLKAIDEYENWVKTCLTLYKENYPDYMTEEEREKFGLISSHDALKSIHFPSKLQEDHLKAQLRLKVDEFIYLKHLFLQSVSKISPPLPLIFKFDHHDISNEALAGEKKKKKKYSYSGSSHERSDYYSKLIDSLSFKLSEEQIQAIEDIRNDLQSKEKCMKRLLQGDTGSGKTIVAIAALALVASASMPPSSPNVEKSCQAVFMAPTEVLVQQHYDLVEKLLSPFGVRVTLLLGGQSSKIRKKILKEISEGKVDVIIGTHACFQESIVYNNLVLSIIDEQQKFGLVQRSYLTDKSESMHILTLTATPIPRSLYLTIFGDLKLSILKRNLPGRLPIITRLCTSDENVEKSLKSASFGIDDTDNMIVKKVEVMKNSEVYEIVKNQLRENRQVFVVYARIGVEEEEDYEEVETEIENEENDGDDVKEEIIGNPSGNPSGRKRALSLIDGVGILNEIFGNDYKIGIVHGRQSIQERMEEMNKFKNKETHILAATTVLEVGIDVPNATVMIVQNAEYFGLSQLHQLRGRVGRSSLQSYCFLLTNNFHVAFDTNFGGNPSHLKLKSLEKCLDGFAVSEMDLKLRGMGQISKGTEQSGVFTRIVSVSDDVALKIANDYLSQPNNIINSNLKLIRIDDASVTDNGENVGSKNNDYDKHEEKNYSHVP